MSKSMIVFPNEEYEARWQKVYGEMKRRGYEVALIWGKGACTWDRMGELLWLVNHYRFSVLARSCVGASAFCSYCPIDYLLGPSDIDPGQAVEPVETIRPIQKETFSP